MNLIKKFVAGLGNQTAPFGFAPEDPEAGYKAGLGYIGDVGANLMANNQSGVDPFANLGASLQQAKQSGTQRNKEQYTAQRLMEEAQLKRQEREQAQQQEAQREELLKSLPPDVQMKARSIPGYLEAYMNATDPALQKPEQQKLYTVDGALVDASGNVVYQGDGGGGGAGGSPDLGLNLVPLTDKDGNFAGWGQPSKGGGIYPAQVQGEEGLVPMSPYDRKFSERVGTKEGDAVGEARGDLPGAIKQAEITTTKIADLENDPTLEAALGWTSYLPDKAVTSEVIAIRGKVDELMGGAFLEARTMLKGGGQITDYEGMRAERAYARMERAIQAGDPKVFKEALADFKQAVSDGVEKLRATARLPGANAGGGESRTRHRFNAETGELE
jgi:hypothetical protein